MNEMQNVVFHILCEFDRICRENHIRYFVVGGTLLGAVRHQGFIPWDDDVDVGMLRQDYERFIKIAQQLLPAYLFVQNYKTDPEFVFGFTKIRDSRTTYIEAHLKNRKMNHGIFIDVFPFDYYPMNPIKQSAIIIKKRILSCGVRKAFLAGDKNKTLALEAFITNKLGNMVSMKYPSVTDIIKARDQLLKSVPESELVTNYYGFWGSREIVPAAWLKESTPLCFEGLKVMAPSYYDAYLRNVYGDYMILPPLEKRVSHHYTEVVDTSKPYTEYLR